MKVNSHLAIAHSAPGAENVRDTVRRAVTVAVGGNINVDTIGINVGESNCEGVGTDNGVRMSVKAGAGEMPDTAGLGMTRSPQRLLQQCSSARLELHRRP